MLSIRAGSQDVRRNQPLKGKKVYIPAMAYGSTKAFASVFRLLGVDADLVPPSDERTLELGARFTSGDECYPAKITMGDFMKLLERPDVDPSKVVLFMPTTDGPCRFGQYAPFLAQTLAARGYHQTEIISPSSSNEYEGLGDLAGPFVRTAWRGLVSADILQKMLLRYRPYEVKKGTVDAAYEESLNDLCRTIENTPTTPAVQLRAFHDSLVRSRGRFRAVPIHRDSSTPLIGVVGEIFCRFNTFSNDDLIRRLEEYGGEAWLSGIAEWVWYTNTEHFQRLNLDGRRISKEALVAWIREHVQRRDEHALFEPFREEFIGYEEPDIHELLENAEPYLPTDGAMGEMVLSVGKAVYLAKKGADGIIDISPFTCMNGMVSEAIYPRLSRDLGGIPIRNFYFDGTQSDLDRDLGVYIELARSYQRRKNCRQGWVDPIPRRSVEFLRPSSR